MTTVIEKLERYLHEHEGDYANENLLLREVAYKRLYDAFRSVELEPGDLLSTVWLSKCLGISRTPIREALQQLATDGLIQLIQGRAVGIAAPSPQEFFDALYVRELLEPASVRLCASGVAEDALERLQDLMNQMERAARDADRATWSRADHEWHEAICQACPNKLLGQMVLQARKRMYHHGSDEHVPIQYLIEGTEEHRRILEAIASHDDALAERMMIDHLHRLKDNLVNRLVR